MQKNALILFGTLLFTGIHPGFCLTVELRKISDNTLATNVRFTPAQNAATYTQGESYADIQCTPEDVEGLKLFTNNLNWQGGSANDRAGLVNNPPTRRVPVYWQAFGTPQTITMTAQNEANWKTLQDQNTNGFSGLDPSQSNITCPSTGRAYIYFAAKMNSTTASAFYTTALNFSNVAVGGGNGGPGQSGGASAGDGFGAFNTVFRPSQNQILEIPINLSKDGRVDVDIYSRGSDRIKQLFSGEKTSGSHVLTWDGKSDNNTMVSSGMYFVVLKSGKTYRKKIVVIR